MNETNRMMCRAACLAGLALLMGLFLAAPLGVGFFRWYQWWWDFWWRTIK